MSIYEMSDRKHPVINMFLDTNVTNSLTNTMLTSVIFLHKSMSHSRLQVCYIRSVKIKGCPYLKHIEYSLKAEAAIAQARTNIPLQSIRFLQMCQELAHWPCNKTHYILHLSTDFYSVFSIMFFWKMICRYTSYSFLSKDMLNNDNCIWLPSIVRMDCPVETCSTLSIVNDNGHIHYRCKCCVVYDSHLFVVFNSGKLIQS